MPFSICNAAERSTLWPGALKRALAWPVSQPTARRGWQFAAFRDWKAREHLRAAYEIAPRVWRSESLARVADKSAAERVVWKNCEPCFTGLAYTERHIYLTLAVGALEPAAAGCSISLTCFGAIPITPIIETSARIWSCSPGPQASRLQTSHAAGESAWCLSVAMHWRLTLAARSEAERRWSPSRL